MPGGRPRKGQAALAERITIRLTEEEHEILVWLACKSSLSTAELVRSFAQDSIQPYTVEGVIKRDVPPANCNRHAMVRINGPGDMDLEYHRDDGLVVVHSYRDGDLSSQFVGSLDGGSLWVGDQPPVEWRDVHERQDPRFNVEDMAGRPGDSSITLSGRDSHGVWHKVRLHADGSPDEVDSES